MTTDYDDLLDAYLAGETDDGAPVEGEPPDPKDADEVDRLLRRVARVEREAEAISAAAQRRIEETKAWAADLLAGLARKREWLEQGIIGYATKHFEGQPEKVRTVNLPSGKLMRRQQQPRVPDHPQEIVTAVHQVAPELAPAGKPTLAKNVVKDRCVAGAALGPATPDGYVPHQAVLRGDPDPETGEVPETVIGGLVILIPTADKITYKPGG